MQALVARKYPAFLYTFPPYACESAWKKDPLRGVIGVQKGPLC